MANFIYISTAAPTSWAFYAAYAANNTFTPPESGWYRIYCIGKSGDGGSDTERTGYGRGGGGSGGMAISNLMLSRGTGYTITFNSGTSNFASLLSATAGGSTTITGGLSGSYGGTGGTASGGNVANLTGYKGGQAGYGDAGVYPTDGADGENGGMRGGFRGSDNTSTQSAGGGGGGGARLPGSDICRYISGTYTTLYRAGDGGNRQTAASHASDPYPAVTLNSSLQLFGGGGGGGGHGWTSGATGGAPSNGSPAVIIIERPS